MAIERCKSCGTFVPAHYTTRGLCDECKWNTWIPPGYQKREEYEMDVIWGHVNATQRPPLGVEFLDRRGPLLSELLPMCKCAPIVKRRYL
ncbi:MAG: hypothetical protein HQ546_09940 [Planctomycetes bacterium]|nr:hypothetical protein [Planctomycetota bacterium]